MKLSDHFSLEELTVSEIGKRFNIDNTPNESVIANLKRLAQLLEEVRLLLNKPIRINSAYRCLELNSKIGSKSNSQHTIGCAADITVNGMTPDDIVKTVMNSNIKYDQLIREYDSWVHISIPNAEGNVARKNTLIIDKQGTRAYA